MDAEIQFGDDAQNGRWCVFRSQNKLRRTVQNEIEGYNIPEEIAGRAAEIYRLLSDGKTHREKPRRRLEFYCTFCAFVEFGRHVDPLLLGAQMGGLPPGQVRKAFTRFAPNRAYTLPVVITEPWDLVAEYSELAGPMMTEAHIRRAIATAHYLGERYPVLTSNIDLEGEAGIPPGRMAAVVVVLYCRENGLPIDETAFLTRLGMTGPGLQAQLKKVENLLRQPRD